MKSKLFLLNIKDIINAAIRAGFITGLTAIVQLMQAGPIEWTYAFWQPTIYVAIIAVLGSLLKSLTTNSKGEFAKPE